MLGDTHNIPALHHYVPFVREPGFNPVLIAGIFAGGYFLFCSLYIWLSGAAAAHYAGSVADLHRIETIKGILFIAITTIMIFSVIWILLARLHSDEIKLIQQQDEVIKSQRESVAGIFASSVAHDINNIIMVLNYYCEQLGNARHDSPEFKDVKSEIKTVLSELKELAGRLMRVGKGNLPSEVSIIDIAALARNTAQFMRKHEAMLQISLNFSGPDTLEIDGNESAMRQLLINLILNAAQAIDGKGEINVVIAGMEKSVLIEIHDSGPGIEPVMRERIFEAFNTTKSSGFGLGLTSVKVYADMHKGKVEVGESNLGGACFRITLPVRCPETNMEMVSSV